MRYSANLNIIIKAIEKVSNLVSRDYMELENLQSNPTSASKFSIASYNRVKKVLIEDFIKFRPDFNIVFSDGEKIINNENAEYSLVIHAIDGFDNLLRASSDFAISIALIHKANNGKEESISLAIHKIVGGELYYSEKGFGAFLNNRRIRVSKRITSDKSRMLVACDDVGLSQKLNLNKPRSNGCRTLEIAHLASAKIEKMIFSKKDSELFQAFFLLVREAGGSVVEENEYFELKN